MLPSSMSVPDRVRGRALVVEQRAVRDRKAIDPDHDSAHESASRLIGADRTAVPSRHSTADSRSTSSSSSLAKVASAVRLRIASFSYMWCR